MRSVFVSSIAAVGLALALTASAHAADPTGSAARSGNAGPYVSFGLGLNFLNDADFSGSGVGETAEYNTGWSAIGAAGYRMDTNWRGEVELGYRNNGIDKLHGGPGNEGSVHSMSVMGNVLYDINLGAQWTPYVGVGIGAVSYRADGLRPTATTTAHSDDTNFAYQGILGVSYDLRPGTQLYVDYRYLHSQDPDIHSSDGTSIRTQYRTNTVMVGLRYTFNGLLGGPVGGGR